MQFRNTAHRYGWVSRVLHWTTVVIVLVLYVDIMGLDVPPKLAMRDAVVDRHALLGTIVLVLMCTRFLWRQCNPNPVHGYALPAWNRRLAMAVHRSLYALVIALCVLGLIAHYGTGVALSATALDVHDTLAGLLLAVVAGHAVAGVYNQALGPVPE
ncbi:MAG: cytochrome b/b6 domain-containing protein [Gammaproteobacteria bacterium]